MGEYLTPDESDPDTGVLPGIEYPNSSVKEDCREIEHNKSM